MFTISIRAPYGLLIEMQNFFIKYAIFFRQFDNQNPDSLNDAPFFSAFTCRLSMLSVEPPILAVYEKYVCKSRLYLAIIRFNMQAATFEFLREPVESRLDAPRSRCKIIDNLFCVFRSFQPAYFASYKFDERWQLVDCQVHLSQEANVQLYPTSLFCFACSRLWISNFVMYSGFGKLYLAELKQISFIERGHTELHSLSLKPLPKALDDLQDQAEKSNPKMVICAR